MKTNVSKGMLLVSIIWLVACLLGAFPFYFSGHLSFADAFFESTSGFTTTGASVFSNVEILPRPLLFWRSFIQWLGGMGIVVLFVALAPIIGAGAPQLFKAETPGPEKAKITPRVAETAKIFWIIYVALTLLQILLLLLGGLNLFDATTITLSTMPTGGFSTKNASIAAFDSAYVEWVCIVFMAIGGFSFILIFKLFQGKAKEVLKNSEAKVYLGIILIAGFACACFEPNLRKSLFQCISILTTTGFSASDHNAWHPMALSVLFILMFIGGCSSSTGGGIKVIRHLILFKQARNELMKHIYPRGVFSIQINGKAGKKNIVHGVAAFVFLYLLLALCATLLVAVSEQADIFSSLNIGVLLTGNIGLGIVNGSMESILQNLPAFSKYMLSFIMLAGRLELWTIFAIIYWVGSKK